MHNICLEKQLSETIVHTHEKVSVKVESLTGNGLLKFLLPPNRTAKVCLGCNLRNRITEKSSKQLSTWPIRLYIRNHDLGKFCWVLAMEDVGILYVHLVYFTAIWFIFVAFWYILWLFGIFFPVLVCCTKKNLATPNDTVYYFRFPEVSVRICSLRSASRATSSRARSGTRGSGPRYVEHAARGPFLTSPLAPRGKTSPLEVNLAPKCEICPLVGNVYPFVPRGERSLCTVRNM
jgi:hypothetical protein